MGRERNKDDRREGGRREEHGERLVMDDGVNRWAHLRYHWDRGEYIDGIYWQSSSRSL
jgi:hypothetical protein